MVYLYSLVLHYHCYITNTTVTLYPLSDVESSPAYLHSVLWSMTPMTSAAESPSVSLLQSPPQLQTQEPPLHQESTLLWYLILTLTLIQLLILTQQDQHQLHNLKVRMRKNLQIDEHEYLKRLMLVFKVLVDMFIFFHWNFLTLVFHYQTKIGNKYKLVLSSTENWTSTTFSNIFNHCLPI